MLRSVVLWDVGKDQVKELGLFGQPFKASDHLRQTVWNSRRLTPSVFAAGLELGSCIRSIAAIRGKRGTLTAIRRTDPGMSKDHG